MPIWLCKKDGRGEVVVFETYLLRDYEFRQRIEGEFRAALAQNTIELHYQPIVSLRTGLIQSVESLARWTDSRGARISPSYFIPLAEQCGIIRGVGHTLLEKALLETRNWLVSGAVGHVSFNVSPLEFLDQDFADFVLSSMKRARVSPRYLVLEITEGAVFKNIQQAERVMNRLRRHGVEFALDDFGCGYSNLSSLSHLPISTLKIDRSLLVDADRDKSARIILRNVIALCKDLAIKSVCEGAETDEQIKLLREMDCDSVQGFVSGVPACAADLRPVLDRQRANKSSSLCA
jgi:EAL domain-containing protein (putative c-di-GMP-specific phosphodiesterase class I)